MADDVDGTYTESQVILNAVKLIAPFTLTYGMFMALHGADSPGGSFQGGTIIGVTVLMLAFAFGIEPTRYWLKNSVLTGLVAGGVVIFASVGLLTIALGGNFLEYDQFYSVLGIKQKWGMEAIEIGGVALIVSGVVITLFFSTAAGFTPLSGDDLETDGGPDVDATGTLEASERDPDVDETGGDTR